jgi:hypothetical protein
MKHFPYAGRVWYYHYHKATLWRKRVAAPVNRPGRSRIASLAPDFLAGKEDPMKPTVNKWKFITDFRMLSILLIIAMVPFLLGTWWLFSSYQETYLDAQGTSLAEAAEMAFNYLNNYLGNQIIDVAGLTEVPVLREAIEKKNLDLNKDLGEVRKEIVALAQRWHTLDYKSPELKSILDSPASEFLRRYTSIRVPYREIIVTDFLGRTIAATGKTSDFHHANDEWWKEAYSDGQKGGIYIGDIHFHESIKSYLFDIAQPFVDPKGGVMGVIMVGIDAQEIYSLIESLRSSFDGTAALIHADGSVISASGYGNQDKRPFPAASEILNGLAKGKRYVISQSEPRAIFGLNPRSFVEMYPHLNWILTISSPVRSVVSPLSNLRLTIVILMLVVVVGTFLVALWLSRVESKPVLEEDAHFEKL